MAYCDRAVVVVLAVVLVVVVEDAVTATAAPTPEELAIATAVDMAIVCVHRSTLRYHYIDIEKNKSKLRAVKGGAG